MTSSDSILGLIGAVDDLYRGIVDAPHDWDPQAFGSWFEEAGSAFDGPIDRSVARELRRAVRARRKLQQFCVSGKILDGGDWRSVVDQALGSRAWLPSLQMAKAGLEASPTPELFAEVQNRFPVVHFTPWMEGVDFEQWVSDRGVEDG